MKLFLSHKIDVYNFSEPTYIGFFDDGTIKELSIKDLIIYPNEIITYQVRRLINQFRKVYIGELPKITDFEQISKINFGRSKKSYVKGKFHWIFWNHLNKDIGIEESKRLYSIIRQESEVKEVFTALEYIAKKLKVYYEDAIFQIQESHQFNRVIKLENEVQQILYKRQLEGIHIHGEILKDLITNLEVNRNALVYKLRYKYNLIDLNYKSIRLFLIENGYKISKHDFSYFNLIGFLKTTKITSILCRDIYNALRIKSDYESLQQYITEEGDIIFPEFDCIGTITSRIIITYPHIQQLKKENRIIFRAKSGFTLLYCDFKQFEPGILASFSNDKVMIELYNSEDIYTKFSEYIFGTTALRKEAKVLFLSYLYGMSNKRLISTIEDVIKTKRLIKNSSATDFFSKFMDLEKFKTSEFEKAIEFGFIQSDTTLRRNLRKSESGRTKKSETRFVLSQLIQGGASYILKKSILEVFSDQEIEFLVPMHDAVLYQVPTEKLEAKRVFIENCFLRNYRLLCPEIKAMVEFKPFED